MNGISESMQQEMEKFFDRLGNGIAYIINYGNCVGA